MGKEDLAPLSMLLGLGFGGIMWLNGELNPGTTAGIALFVSLFWRMASK